MSRYKLPDKDFEWSPELAYAIGLLVTDGNLSKDGRHITMRSTDFDLLETYKKCLNLISEIKLSKNDGKLARKPSYRIQSGSIQFYRWLLKIGLFPNKTYTIGPIQVPLEYFQDFLRGHLDGDGTITTYKDSYNTFKNPKYVYQRLWLRFMSASEVHIRWLQSCVMRCLGVSGHLAKTKVYKLGHVPIWWLKFGKKDSLKVLEWMYYSPSVPCLARKREIAQKFIYGTY